MSISRVSKSIKLTDDDFLALQKASDNSSSESFREYCEVVVCHFMDKNTNKEELLLLKPAKSAAYRPIALSFSVAKRLKKFATSVDASANSIIHTAFKQSVAESVDLISI